MNLEKRQERFQEQFQGRFRDWLRARFARLPARDRNRSDAGQQGFTLVEMLVVITIIGLIMGLIGPRVLNYLSESKVKAAKIQLQSFGSALDLFYLDAGRFPSTSEGLTALVQRTPGIAAWNGPYLKGGNVPNDPWNHPYVYRSPGERSPYEIVSYGADGQEGGAGVAADISTENLVSAKNE
jgi:general secretion pathway protein G